MSLGLNDILSPLHSSVVDGPNPTSSSSQQHIIYYFFHLASNIRRDGSIPIQTHHFTFILSPGSFTLVRIHPYETSRAWGREFDVFYALA